MLKKPASFVLAALGRLHVPTRERACLGRLGGRAGEEWVRIAYKNGRLTDSPASTNMALIILRAVDLAAAALDGLFEHPADGYSRSR
jgi:hypothetical protein